jgi:hypothetical protein
MSTYSLTGNRALTSMRIRVTRPRNCSSTKWLSGQFHRDHRTPRSEQFGAVQSIDVLRIVSPMPTMTTSVAVAYGATASQRRDIELTRPVPASSRSW